MVEIKVWYVSIIIALSKTVDNGPETAQNQTEKNVTESGRKA